jgi:hypothetical protein
MTAIGVTAMRRASANLVRKRQGRREIFLRRTPERLKMPAMTQRMLPRKASHRFKGHCKSIHRM